MNLSVRAAMSRHDHSVATMQHEKASFLCLFVCTLHVCYHFTSLLLWPLANHNAVDPEDRQFRRMGQPASANVRRDQRVRFCELFIGCRDMLRILVPCHAMPHACFGIVLLKEWGNSHFCWLAVRLHCGLYAQRGAPSYEVNLRVLSTQTNSEESHLQGRWRCQDGKEILAKVRVYSNGL